MSPKETYMYQDTEYNDRRTIQMTNFDVALEVSEGGEAKGGIGVFSGVLGIGAQGTTTGSSSEISRVSFSIPMVLPYQR